MPTTQVREVDDNYDAVLTVRREEQSLGWSNAYASAPLSLSYGSVYCYFVTEQNGYELTGGKGEPPKRFGLTDAFRAQASWGDGTQDSKQESAKDTGVVRVRLMRTIDPEDYARRCNWLEAINLERTDEDYSECVRVNRKYMRDRLYEVQPAALDFIHAGRAIVESAGFEIESAVVQNCLYLTKGNSDIDIAFYAAITAVVNSCPGPADWDMIVLALATFVHTLPHFKSIVQPGEFHQPFGDKTGWRMARKNVL